MTTIATTAEVHRQELRAIFLRIEKEGYKPKRAFGLDEIKDAQKRRQQLEVLKGFFGDPARLDLRHAAIPTSSSAEELARHRETLTYRLECLKAMVELTQGELETLDRAQPAVDD